MPGAPVSEQLAHCASSLAFTVQAAVHKSHLHLAHLSISAWVHGDNTGELPHAMNCVFVLHKDNIIDGQVPARSQSLLTFLQAEEELFLPMRPEFVGQVLYTSPMLACVYVSWLEGSRGC